MVQYRYACDADGKIVDAVDLSKLERNEGWQFVCLGCNQPLTAKVHGHRQPHFAHRPDATCCDESYMHQLGKKVFVEEFNKCRESGEPFEIELPYPLFCRKFETELGQSCQFRERQMKTHDLATLFSDVLVECPVGSFVPDLLLTNKQRPDFKIFIEIAVTHFLSEKKEQSCERIIEIPIDYEEDLQKIRSRKLTEDTCRFVNFITEGQTVTDSECRCSSRSAYALIVWESGKCELDKSTLEVLVSKRRRSAEKIRYFRVIDVEQPGSGYLPLARDSFRRGVQKAHAEGFEIKNCYLCRYHRDNFNGDPVRSIFCKHLKKTFNSNEALSCTAFQPQEKRPIA